MPHVRPAALVFLGAALVAPGAVGHAQTPVPKATGPAAPREDLVTMRGCREGNFLRVVDHDATDLSGTQTVRLKLTKSMKEWLDSIPGVYLEVTGLLDLGRRDREDLRVKQKVGSKTTVFLGAASEQRRDREVTPDPVLIVEGFAELGDKCPGRSLVPTGDRPEGGREVNPPQSVVGQLPSGDGP